MPHFPRPVEWSNSTVLAAPDASSLVSTFAYPSSVSKPIILHTALGRTALYDIPPARNSNDTKEEKENLRIVMVHGLNTPALGLLPLARELQKLRRDTHIVLFDLFGHGLSDTPLIPHTSHIFHLQIMQVLAHMQWTKAHFIGFSFGGPTTLSFLRNSPVSVQSVTLLASAGLVKVEKELRELLDDDTKEEEARDALMDWLEGGVLVVPTDWQKRSREGDIVAEALRHWELNNHEGYVHSVLSMFRDGGACGREEDFRHLVSCGVPYNAIVADQDGVCTKPGLEALGVKNVKTVRDAGHSFVRSHAAEAAALIIAQYALWESSEPTASTVTTEHVKSGDWKAVVSGR